MPVTLSQLAPQLVVGLAGLEISAIERRLLESAPPAGVILFARNVSSTDQLKSLTRDIISTITGASGITPLVMADHEGGRISVLFRAFGTPPSQLATARAGDLELCRCVYRETARRMVSCDVNVMLGPVADVNTEPNNPVIGTRSFGGDPASVAVLVRESVKVCREWGLAACIKHFPGHGSTTEDSHVALPSIRRASHELKRIDRPPFGAGIWAGAELVMTGHIVPPDCTGPATLEPGIIVGILREELCFDGVVITDALEMAGVRQGLTAGGERADDRSPKRIVDLALRAGNDLLLFSRPIEDVYGELEPPGEYRIDPRSLRRIDMLRRGVSNRRRGLFEDSAHEPVRKINGRIDPYREVASRSIEVKRDPRKLLPIVDETPRSIHFVGEKEDFGNGVVAGFASRIIQAFDREGRDSGDAGRILSDRTCLTGGIERAEYSPAGAAGPVILVFLNRRPIGPELLDELTAAADIVVVTDWPEAAEMLDLELTVVSTYGIYDAAADALLEAL
jgi:beta-glucosidase-like glycosyl hydrolase